MTEEIRKLLLNIQTNLSLSGISSYDYMEYWRDSFIEINSLLKDIDKVIEEKG